jgi:hypothetical protein
MDEIVARSTIEAVKQDCHSVLVRTIASANQDPAQMRAIVYELAPRLFFNSRPAECPTPGLVLVT